MIDGFNEWYEAECRRKLALSDEQREFVTHHKIGLSLAYVGMIRAYHGNRTVWQTSAWGPILGAYDAKDSPDGMKGWFEENDLQIRRQLHAWLDDLMAQSEDEIARRLEDHVPLFSV